MTFPVPLDASSELRLMEERHAEEIFAVVEGNREHLREWLPWVDETHTADDTRRFIASMAVKQAAGEGVTAGIWTGGRFAGAIGLRIDRANRTASIGYWIAREHQGKGLVTAACRALTGYAFGEGQLDRVELRAASGNTRSLAVAKRLGFRVEGTLRRAARVGDRSLDMVVHSLLPGE